VDDDKDLVSIGYGVQMEIREKLHLAKDITTYVDENIGVFIMPDYFELDYLN